MIPYRALCSNILFAYKVLPMVDNTTNVVAMLPSAHMYGMMFEVLFELTAGAHVHFLTRVPSPKIIMQALAEVKPIIVVAVPLIIEKVYKSKLKPLLEKNGIKFLMKLPVLDQVIMKKIRTELINAFGGCFEEVIIGGAAFNKEVDTFFKKIGFPYTVGYGMTECAPIISYDDWKTARLYSCGKAAPNMEIRIDSEDPENVPGEVLVKGMNVFLGYYKNPEATEASFTKDGWFRTGDMGVMDKDGYLYLRGRFAPGTVLRFVFAMPARFVRADARVRADAGKAAVMRGPLVYCMEGADNGKGLHLCLFDTSKAPQPDMTALPGLGRVPTLTVSGVRQSAPDPAAPYEAAAPAEEPAAFRLLPYFLWANRETGEMQVFTREKRC